MIEAGLNTPAPDVERETGWLAVIAPSVIELKPRTVTDELLRVDRSELPDWAGRAPHDTTIAFKYLRPGYKLTLDAKRFEEAQVLQALVEKAEFRSVISDDGQMMTEMRLQVRNNARQHIEVALPQGAEVWSAFVGGLPVRPTLRNGRVQLPLERGIGTELINVELTYVSKVDFPAYRGRLAFATPSVDLPLKNARWDFYLPFDYRYNKFEGTMLHQTVAAPVHQTYTAEKYMQEEGAKRQERQSVVMRDLEIARRNIQIGDLEAANKAFNRALQGGKGDARFISQLQIVNDSLLTNVGTVVAGVNSGIFSNAGRIVQQAVPPPPPVMAQQQAKPVTQPKQQDFEAAAQQWHKMQQAQDVTSAQAQPLRVILPSRGITHSFTQVLQTTPNEPMTVEFTATNAKKTGWPLKAAGGVAGFLALWFLVSRSLALRHRLHTA